MVKRIINYLARKERVMGYCITSLAAIIISFIIGKSFVDSIKLCIIPFVALIAGMLIVRGNLIIKSKLLGFGFFIISMILGSLIYELYCADTQFFGKIVIWFSPLLWLLYDLFYSTND